MIELIEIEQRFPCPVVADIEAACRAEAAKLCAAIPAGSRVALAIGSRGIHALPRLVAVLAETVRTFGSEPFIVPAMGSHGGATAEGQAQVLASYGIDEERLGVPVRSSMETVELPQGESPVPVCIDAYAAASNGVIMLNRIKPHTSFHGRYESGLVKMAAVGLGKQRQAATIHHHGLRGLREIMPKVGAAVLESGLVLGGIAVVENACDEIMHIEGISASGILTREPALLDLAKANMPRLPLERIDILIVDRIGKDISGLGMDPNVIGRLGITGEPDPGLPAIRVIVVGDLTDATHGNALGIGLADITTRRLFRKIDTAAMYANALTTTFTNRAKIPLVAETDEQALDFACRLCADTPLDQLVVLRITDTLHLSRLWASPAAVAQPFFRKNGTDSQRTGQGTENQEVTNQ